MLDVSDLEFMYFKICMKMIFLLINLTNCKIIISGLTDDLEHATGLEKMERLAIAAGNEVFLLLI